MEKTIRPRIVLLMGLPGAGKSTWASGKPGVLSSDAVRELLIDDPENQSIHWHVFHVVRNLLEHRLTLQRPVTYIDATNLTPRERRPYIRLADLFDAEIEAMFFDVPLEECLRRNSGRIRIVPDDAIRAMAAKLVPPSIEEGFSRVVVMQKLRE